MPSQCLLPQGMVCEVHLWCVVKEGSAVEAVIFLVSDCEVQSGDTVNLSGNVTVLCENKR